MTEEGTVTAPDGVRLHYVKVGAGRRWLLVPGVGNEADFGPLARRHTVVFFDLRNRGRSDAVPAGGAVGFPVEVDDVDAVRRHFGLDRVDLFGWSYVGLVVARYAARHPAQVGRLVLACPVPLREGPPPQATTADRRAEAQLAQLQASGLDRTDPVAFARAWRRITVPARMGDPAAYDRLRVDPSDWPNEQPERMVAALARVRATLPPDADHGPEVAAISAPALVVAGEADRLCRPAAAEAWATTIPGARLVVLPGVGHYPQAEAPDDLFAAVDVFLS